VALDQSALLEVLDALTAAEVDDRIRQAAQTMYQALIEAELTSVIGAAPNQRTPERVGASYSSHLRRPAYTHGSAHRADLVARSSQAAPRQLARRV
jgi:putative transposase